MTELSFLIELLLHHKLAKPTKDLISKRIKDVEESIGLSRGAVHTNVSHGIHVPSGVTHPVPQLVNGAVQSPSTLAAMARHAGAPPTVSTVSPIATQPVQPVEIVAQTPQTAAAMQQRQEMINAAIAGKRSKTTPLVAGGK